VTLYYDAARKRAKVVVYAGLDERGRQRQRTRSWKAPNERQARREAARVEAALRERITGERATWDTVGHLVDLWQQHRDGIDSPSTVRGRAALLERIRGRFGRVKLDALNGRHLDEWYAELRQEGLAPSTILNAHSTMRAILRQGVKWDMCTEKATRQASPPERPRRQSETLTASAVRALIDSASPDLRVCAHLLAATGMRRGELLALTLADIDWMTHVIRIDKRLVVDKEGRMQVKPATKTGTVRTVPVDPATLGMLAGRRLEIAARLCDLGVDPMTTGVTCALIPDLAHDPTGRTPRHPNWLTLAWSRHCRRQGARMRVHDLRHWHASMLLDAGVPVTTVSKRLGHASTKMTLDTYAHGLEASDVAAAVTIARELSP
jgi:integrase